MIRDLHDPVAQLPVLIDASGQGRSGGISEDHIGFGEALRLFGESLGQTAGEDQHGTGIFPAAAAQELPQLAVALPRHGAGIKHNYSVSGIGGSGEVFAGFIAVVGHTAHHGLRLVLIDLAAERIKQCPHGIPPSKLVT